MDRHVLRAGGRGTRTTTGAVRWGAPGSLRSLVEDLAVDLDVERGKVNDLDIGAATVVLAMPDPQARRLCGDHPMARVLDREWSR